MLQNIKYDKLNSRHIFRINCTNTNIYFYGAYESWEIGREKQVEINA